MAVIYYRFRSQRPDHTATIKFDGTGLTVFELKREIIMANNLLTSADVDVILYTTENIQDVKGNSQGERELTDDNEVIPRSTTVLVRRTMCAKRGKGNVQRYVTGKPKLHIASSGTQTEQGLFQMGGSNGEPGNEEDMIQRMFSAQDEQWNVQQDAMALASRVDTYRPGANEPVPDYYICYKCGEKGKHAIKNCPKNNDPNWEGVRVRKTTGIPKSYLKQIEKPEGASDDVLPNGSTAYMVNEEGKYVVAVADTKAWEKFQDIKKGETNFNDDFDVEDGELKDTETGKLWKNPVRTPCCNKIYSKNIVEDKLIDSDFKCPNCGKEEVYIDSLVPDEILQEKVNDYMKNPTFKATDQEPASKKRQTQPVGGIVGISQTSGLPMMAMPPFMSSLPQMSNIPNPASSSAAGTSNISNIPSIPKLPNMPNLPNMPIMMPNMMQNLPNMMSNMPNMPNMPNMLNMPNMPNMSNMPNMPPVPNMPNMMNMPFMPFMQINPMNNSNSPATGTPSQLATPNTAQTEMQPLNK